MPKGQKGSPAVLLELLRTSEFARPALENIPNVKELLGQCYNQSTEGTWTELLERLKTAIQSNEARCPSVGQLVQARGHASHERGV